MIATIIGTPAFLAWLMASMVWGITWSSAATTSTTMSVTWAPRARMAVNAWWPGVSRKVILRSPGRVDVIGADVLGDSAGLAGHDVGLADVVEQRGLAVVDVAHDGDHRRPRHQLLGRVVGGVALDLRRVLVLPDRLEAERRGDQLDLVEVEALVDRHHQAQLLERELDDLGGGHLHRARELGHGDELVDPDAGLLSLPLLGQPAGLHLAEATARRGDDAFPPAVPFMPCRVRRMLACTAS